MQFIKNDITYTKIGNTWKAHWTSSPKKKETRHEAGAYKTCTHQEEKCKQCLDELENRVMVTIDAITS